MIGRSWIDLYGIYKLQSIFLYSSDQTVQNMVWSIDVSFAVHIDIKSYTGYCLSLGTESHILGSLEQKLNTSSSTELELVGVNDVIRFVKWTSLYCKDQV